MAHDHVLLAIGPDDRDSLDTLVDATINLAEPADATVYLLYVFPRDDYGAVMEQMDIDTTTSRLTPDEVAQRHESVRNPPNDWRRLASTTRSVASPAGIPLTRLCGRSNRSTPTWPSSAAPSGRRPERRCSVTTPSRSS
jgi:hypothetical protein